MTDVLNLCNRFNYSHILIGDLNIDFQLLSMPNSRDSHKLKRTELDLIDGFFSTNKYSNRNSIKSKFGRLIDVVMCNESSLGILIEPTLQLIPNKYSSDHPCLNINVKKQIRSDINLEYGKVERSHQDNNCTAIHPQQLDGLEVY